MQGPPCYITRLPEEILTQIIQNLHVKDKFLVQMTQESAADLANVAIMSRQFYRLAMPLLWGEVEMCPSRVRPLPLLRYPGTRSGRALRYIRKINISTDPKHDVMDNTKCNRLRKYISKSFRVLVGAEFVQDLHFHMRLYDPEDYAPELSKKFKAINRLAVRILKHVQNMNLRQLEFSPRWPTANIANMMRIIERKVVALDINTVPLYYWVDRLVHHQKLTKIKVSRPLWHYEDVQGDQFWISLYATFWTAISQLKNITHVEVDSIPLSSALNLQFPHLTRLRLFIWLPISGRQWASSFHAILTQMPNLETLYLHSGSGMDFGQETNAVDITETVCKNLRDVNIGPYLPKGLVATIAKHNANLTSCYFDSRSNNIEDEDIHHLSRCQRLRTLVIRSSISLVTDLAYLTNLSRLNKLNLHYSAGKYIDTQLLLKITLSCSILEKIEISDFISFKRASDPRPFEDQGLADLFAVDVELHPYIEPNYNTGEFVTVEGLDKYVIRLDRLREDRSQFQLAGSD